MTQNIASPNESVKSLPLTNLEECQLKSFFFCSGEEITRLSEPELRDDLKFCGLTFLEFKKLLTKVEALGIIRFQAHALGACFELTRKGINWFEAEGY